MYYLFVILFSVGWILFSIVRNYISKKSPVKWCGRPLLWDKLPNSGDSLKLLIPNDGLKVMRGPINYWWRVISQKMIEKFFILIKKPVSLEMGNRGSKSVTFLLNSITVKEQRVNGSWCGVYIPQLRYTLASFERNYKVKILSNQINRYKSYSLITNAEQPLHKSEINPWFLTGFADAEGCFLVSIYKNNKLRTGWTVQTGFQIELSQKDKVLLKRIQACLGVGNTYESTGRQSIKFYIQSVKNLAVIIDHFDKYPLLTQKLTDYKLFKKVLNIILNKGHLTEEGLLKILSIKASMNNGLSPELKAAFPNITPINRPVVTINEIPDPHWLAGFTDGDGSFFVRVIRSNTHKIGAQVILNYRLTQHKRDIALMQSLIKFFDCGKVHE